MEISVGNIWIINLLVFLLLPLYLVLNSKICRVKNIDIFLDKNNTSILRGLSVIIIFIHHLVRQFQGDSLLKACFINVGFLAVTIFLFVSGYALKTQFNKKDNYLKGFFINKVLRLIIIFIISDILITILYNIFTQKKYGVLIFLKNLLMLKFSDGRQLWFVFIIIFDYVIFYIANKFFDNKKSTYLIFLATILYIIPFVITNKDVHWYNTAICFPLGVAIADYKREIFSFLNKRYCINIISSFILIILGIYLFQAKSIEIIQFFVPIVFIWFILCILIKVNLNGRYLKFMDTISFEFYLVHLGILKMILKENSENSSIYIVIVFLISILISWLINRITTFIYIIGRRRNV